MIFNAVQKMQLNKLVDAILAMPANQARGQAGLELAFVLDESSDLEFVRETAAEIVKTLKAHDRKFQNVRCNAVFWEKDGHLYTEIMPMAFMQLGRIWDNRTIPEAKESQNATLEALMSYLKFYHARSKCIFVLTDQVHEEGEHSSLISNVNPFLKSKLLFVTPEGVQKWHIPF